MTSPIMKRINWGIRFPRPAAAAGGLPLVTAPLPERVLVPLNQNIGFPADPLVAVGEQVRKGQPIGAFVGSAPSAPIHAPVSGTVASIDVRPATGRGDALCIEITADGKDEAWPNSVNQNGWDATPGIGWRRTNSPIVDACKPAGAKR